jgi:hypothetical protein
MDSRGKMGYSKIFWLLLRVGFYRLSNFVPSIITAFGWVDRNRSVAPLTINSSNILDRYIIVKQLLSFVWQRETLALTLENGKHWKRM